MRIQAYHAVYICKLSWNISLSSKHNGLINTNNMFDDRAALKLIHNEALRGRSSHLQCVLPTLYEYCDYLYTLRKKAFHFKMLQWPSECLTWTHTVDSKLPNREQQQQPLFFIVLYAKHIYRLSTRTSSAASVGASFNLKCVPSFMCNSYFNSCQQILKIKECDDWMFFCYFEVVTLISSWLNKFNQNWFIKSHYVQWMLNIMSMSPIDK